MNDDNVPTHLKEWPNRTLDKLTLDELRAELAYWVAQVKTAPGFASAKAADDCRKGCATWIRIREREAVARKAGIVDSLVDRLRHLSATKHDDGLGAEAADEIERLRAAVIWCRDHARVWKQNAPSHLREDYRRAFETIEEVCDAELAK